jgi:hypothetical protein
MQLVFFFFEEPLKRNSGPTRHNEKGQIKSQENGRAEGEEMEEDIRQRDRQIDGYQITIRE